MPRTHYAHAPIVEAIINIQFNVDEACSLESIEAYGKSLSDRYPVEHKMWEANTSVTLNPNETSGSEIDFHVVGYRFETVNEPKRVLQFRPDSFTLSWLPPYDCWEVFRDEAKDLWRGFWSVIQMPAIQRIAVRYVNRIDIGFLPNDTTISMADYFTIYPYLPDEPLLEHMQTSHSLLQVQMPQPDLKGILIVNQAIVPPPRQNVFSVLLDLDVFSDQGWGQDQEDAWTFMERLRDRKNQAFESFITDKTRELFQ